MISYEPLFATLSHRGINLYELSDALNFSTRTRAKFRKNESITLETISKICAYLQCPIEKVVYIDYTNAQ